MFKLVAAGAAIFTAGAVKFALHLGRTPTIEDYLAFRCGGDGAIADIIILPHSLAGMAHCWGCYAMVVGALHLLAAVSRFGLRGKQRNSIR